MTAKTPRLLCLLGVLAVSPAAGLTFAQHRFPSGGRTPFAVAIADLDGDRRLDLAVTNASSPILGILLATPEGFRPAPGVAVDTGARGLAAADLDADGNADLAIASAVRSRLAVLRGDGRGGGTVRTVPTGLAPFQVAIADLNGDGALDVAVADECNIPAYAGRGEVSVLFGDGRGGFTAGPTLRADTHPADIVAADFDGDQAIDLAVVNWGSRNLSLFRNRGPLAEPLFDSARTVDYRGAPAYAVAAGDLDGDGDTDLVVGDAQGVVHRLPNDGHGTFTAAAPLQAGRGLRSLILADLDGDRRPDLATANTGDDSVSILTQPGGLWSAAQRIAVGTRPRTVRAADLDGDGRVDLVVTNGGSDDLSVLISLNNSLEGAAPAAPVRDGCEAPLNRPRGSAALQVNRGRRWLETGRRSTARGARR